VGIGKYNKAPSNHCSIGPTKITSFIFCAHYGLKVHY